MFLFVIVVYCLFIFVVGCLLLKICMRVFRRFLYLLLFEKFVYVRLFDMGCRVIWSDINNINRLYEEY